MDYQVEIMSLVLIQSTILKVLAGPAFIAVFTVSGVVLGITADYVNRLRLLGAAVLLYSLAIFLMGFASHYWHLVILRMLLAAG